MKKLVFVLCIMLSICLTSCLIQDPPSYRHPENMGDVLTMSGHKVFLSSNPANFVPLEKIIDQPFYSELEDVKVTLHTASTDELDVLYELCLGDGISINNSIIFCGQFDQIMYVKVIISGYVYYADNNIDVLEKLLDYVLLFEFQYENLSKEDFFSIVDSFDNQILNQHYNLNNLEYGRVVSSSISTIDAVRVTTRHFTDERYSFSINTVVDCNVIYENDILYGVNVKWKHDETIYEENVISFKKELADITVRNVVYNDQKSYNISTDIEQYLSSIAVYLYYEEYIVSAILSYKVLNSEDTFKMVFYGFDVCYGDWGVLDQYNLTKATFVVDKVSGNTYFEEQEILSIYYREGQNYI